MAKRKGSSQKTDRTLTIVRNKERRLKKHLKNHPNDAQSASAVGSIKPNGGKKPVGKGMLINRTVTNTDADGKTRTFTMKMHIGGRALRRDLYQLRIEAFGKRVQNAYYYEKWGALQNKRKGKKK